MMNRHYLVILDNNLRDEPLTPGLPYWTFAAAQLPTRDTAAQFVEDVLFQSELWANEGGQVADEHEWLALRLLECHSMCARCGHIMVATVGSDVPPFHVIWYITQNTCPDLFGDEGYINSGLWYGDYVVHRCSENFFDEIGRE